jgi:hypothetical protein
VRDPMFASTSDRHPDSRRCRIDEQTGFRARDERRFAQRGDIVS